MATATRRSPTVRHNIEPIKLLLTQDEADLIRSVLGDLFGDLFAEPYGTTTTKKNRARDVVTDIFLSLIDVTESRSYRLELGGQGGLESDRKPF